MVTPHFLKHGDTVGIISPSRKINPTELEKSVAIIRSWGFKVVKGKHIFASYKQFAGEDEQRAGDFQNMLDNPEVKAILCSRGGYGSVRIIDSLDFSSFITSPKWIAGFSDITVFHSHINRNFGVATLHCDMPLNFGKEETHPDSLESIRKALTGNELLYEGETNSFYKDGITRGVLTGGNLSVLYSLLGSVSDIETDGKILFLEDLDEYLYHVDRMMIAMKRSGKLSRIKGMIVGGMTGMRDNQVPFGKTAEEIIQEHVEGFEIPILFGFPAGHLERNLSMRLGVETELQVSKGSFLVRQTP